MTLEDTGIFINLSKSGKGIVTKFNDELYTVGFETLEKLRNGDYKGITWRKIVHDEPVQA